MASPEFLNQLWAPWRVEYFEVDKSRDFLIEAAQATEDREHLVVRRMKETFLMMNRFPYAVGHLMVVPYRKVAELADLTEGEQLEFFAQAIYAQSLLKRVVQAEGFNIGLNLGKAGGAGVASHLHLHIVPRWEGDSNFMAVMADVRVIPQALESLWEKLIQKTAE